MNQGGSPGPFIIHSFSSDVLRVPCADNYSGHLRMVPCANRNGPSPSRAYSPGGPPGGTYRGEMTTKGPANSHVGYGGEVGRAWSQEVQARRSEGNQAPESLWKNPLGCTHRGAGGEGQPDGTGTGSGPLDITCCHALFHPQSTDPPLAPPALPRERDKAERQTGAGGRS